jgi:putative membrane protein
MMLYLGLFVALLTVVLALQNTTPVTVRFLLWEYDSSLLLMILGAAALGFVLALLSAVAPLWRRTRELQGLSRTVISQAARISRLQGGPESIHQGIPDPRNHPVVRIRPASNS